MKDKKILYVDMDGVLVDFYSGLDFISEEIKKKYEKNPEQIENIYEKMLPIKDAIESFELLFDKFDVYILTTAPWSNISAWSDKLKWVKKYLPIAKKRLIISSHKNLNSGDYLIDDRDNNGASKFKGEIIKFGSDQFKDWKSVLKYLID